MGFYFLKIGSQLLRLEQEKSLRMYGGYVDVISTWNLIGKCSKLILRFEGTERFFFWTFKSPLLQSEGTKPYLLAQGDFSLDFGSFGT